MALHPAVRRQHAKELDDEKVAAADKEAHMKECTEACNKDAFAILVINIANTTFKNRLRRDYYDDAHGAWMYIKAPAHTMVEKLLEQKSELKGSAHYWSDNLLSTTSWTP
eukprot:6213845-Pleurochrysis_carterae.AAC.4